MKKFIFSIMALFATVSLSAADNDNLTLGDVKVAQGKSALLPINITSVDRSYRGFQFLLTLPDGFTVTDVVNAADRTSDVFTLDFKEQSTKGVYQILVYNTKDQYFKGTEGAVAYINITAAEDKAVGEYTGEVSSVVMSTDQSWYFDGSKFKITVVADLLTLDENIGLTSETPTGDQNVLMKRTIKADVWNTICLPYAMTAKQVKDAFGNDVALADFTGCEADGTKDSESTSIKVKFNSVDAIEANHPYLIKVSSTVDQFRTDGVVVSFELDEDVPAEPSIQNDVYSWKQGKTTYYSYNSFFGNYVPNTLVPSFGLFLNNNQFYYSTGKSKLKAFRGYFYFENAWLAESPDPGAKISIYIDDEATGIDGFAVPFVANGVYDLSGRKIQLQDGDLNKLQKGVYIIDGKKVTIKLK